MRAVSALLAELDAACQLTAGAQRARDRNRCTAQHTARAANCGGRAVSVTGMAEQVQAESAGVERFEDYAARLAKLAASVSEAAGQLCDAIWQAYESGRFVFLCGNGGSAANASHFCEDLGKGILPADWLQRGECRRLKAISLTDNVPYILAWANDTGYERIFVEQLKNLASAGDLLIAISGSGNSENVVRAVRWANEHGLKTFAAVGYDGGRLKRLAHGCLHVPSQDMGMVEAVHSAVFHWVVDQLRARLLHARSQLDRTAGTQGGC